MSNTGDVTYSVVKTDDLLIGMNASVASTDASRKMDKNDGVVWNQTVVCIMERVDLSEVQRGTGKDATKANGALCKRVLADYILGLGTDFPIPESGKNRQGQTFKVCGKNGLPMWSSWDKTRRLWDYAGTIGKVLAFSQENLLYPEAMKVGARCDVIKNCKAEEGHMDAIKRQASGLQLSLDKVANGAEALTASQAVNGLTISNLDVEAELKDIVTALTAKLNIANDAQKSSVKSDLIALATKHFANI